VSFLSEEKSNFVVGLISKKQFKTFERWVIPIKVCKYDQEFLEEIIISKVSFFIFLL
jgi:hypothetical protein